MDDILRAIQAGQEEIKHEVIAQTGQIEALTRQVAITNGKVMRHEDEIRALQNAELVRTTIESEKAKAPSQQPAQTSDIVISKKMATAVMGGAGTLLLVLAEAVRQYLAGG